MCGTCHICIYYLYNITFGGIRECHTLQEYQQSTTMFVTLKPVVKDYKTIHILVITDDL